MLSFDYHLFIMFLLQLPFFFDDDLSFENNLYIIKYVMIVNMIMDRIILRGSVGNSNNQPYSANDLAIIISTFVLRSCYYSLMKTIQSFVSHYSTRSYPSLIYGCPSVSKVLVFYLYLKIISIAEYFRVL